MFAPLRMMLVSLAFAALSVAIVPSIARADSWAPPSTQTEVSADGQYRFTVTPSPINSALDYFREEMEAVDEGAEIERTPPMGLLERRQAGGSWVPVWVAPLVNVVAPASFLVSNTGRVVSFDNWHSVGHGENVIAIYDPAGSLVRAMPLTALLPQDYIDALPHTVSSLRWRESSAFDETGGRLILGILVPSIDRDAAATVRFAIKLADGTITRPDESAWQAALAATDEVRSAREAADAVRLAYLRDPLRAPEGCDGRVWHGYLREAFFRLTPDWLDMPTTATDVLLAPDHPKFESSAGWLVEGIADELESPGDMAIAAPCSGPALVDTMHKAFAKIPPGGLSDTTLYISADAKLRADLEPIVGPSGALVHWLDPMLAIPQRPERIPGSSEEAAARAEMQHRQAEEMSEMMEELEGL